MNRFFIFRIIFFASLITGCASMGMNSVEKLNRLSPGMTEDEVITILGEPKSSQLLEDAWVLKFSLHENWKGFVPYYMIFDKQEKKLVSWYADEEEYQKNQEKLGEMFKPLMESQNAASSGPNDTDLQTWIAGQYYSYVGTTERKLVLCPNGKFSYVSESSYSANPNFDGTTDWGAASRSGNTGSWTIQGSRQEGMITLFYDNGNNDSVSYRPTGETNVMTFDNITFSFVKQAQCP